VWTTSDAQKALVHGPHTHPAAAVLLKPITPTALRVAVGKALRARDGVDQPHSPRAATRLAGLRLLVVDDHEVNREVAQLIFSKEGAWVSTAPDGKVQMPLMDGHETTKAIRCMAGLSRLPVVALSADARSEDRTLANQAGMNGYITKPFDVDNAVELILQLVGPAKSMGTGNRDLPGMAISSALAIWCDEGRYKTFLHRFVSHYGRIVEDLFEAEVPVAKALLHKFRGAAANLGLIDVAAAAWSVEAMLPDKPLTREAVLDLQNAMEIARSSVGRYAPAPELRRSSPDTASSELSGEDLQRLLMAWQSDSSAELQTALARVRHGLTKQEQDLQQTCLDSYDFRAGEAATQALIGGRPSHSRSA
jgi:CheY-like chemotaxis protein